jgi:hypothetical protein
LEQAVDKDVAAADFAEEDALGGVVEQPRNAPGQLSRKPQEETQDVVLDEIEAAEAQGKGNPEPQSNEKYEDDGNKVYLCDLAEYRFLRWLAERYPDNSDHDYDRCRRYETYQEGIPSRQPDALAGDGLFFDLAES